MTPIAFYHTAGDTPAALDGVLPPLLEKALKANNRILLITPTPARQQRLDEALWGYSESAFLPHAKPTDPKPHLQPVLIATADDDLASYLSPEHQAPDTKTPTSRIPVLLSGAESALPAITAANPPRILYLFTAATADVERSRQLFKQLKTAGHAMSYHQQTPTGWEKKA